MPHGWTLSRAAASGLYFDAHAIFGRHSVKLEQITRVIECVDITYIEMRADIIFDAIDGELLDFSLLRRLSLTRTKFSAAFFQASPESFSFRLYGYDDANTLAHSG